ncbi:DUF3307 domain-containing protein [Hymenobacter sp. HSC-4F20]|uniref:DUF3307 domain-containing protein n=1 Tax=Hymenobacter sp. HSC-4F20 TaxID=2864135 RepID=UPI001C738E7F|nr:DUF3307 domain-containing protein [Hymenobacter sp. HSC-4F20]MBX0290964.1 DUF3307 domain-containing protein [Hymenobacter sp. HSC-4F20]
MIQLILHLLGDYVLQSDKMAVNKTSSHKWAFIHALLYAIGFAWIVPSVWAWLVIFGTHFLIDRYRLAKYWVRFYNQVSVLEAGPFGYPADKPPFIAFWLMVIIDNTMHLLINFLAIAYL